MNLIKILKNTTAHLVRLNATASIHSLSQQFNKLLGNLNSLNTTTGKLTTPQFSCKLRKLRRSREHSLLTQSLLILYGFVLIVLTSCAPSSDTTTAPPDNPTRLASLIKTSNPEISGLTITSDNSDPADPKLTITGITNNSNTAPVTATITIDQDKGVTTDPASFTVTADNPISPYSTNTALTVTFEGEAAVSYTVTTQISGAAVGDWIVTEKLSEYITISFGGQSGNLSLTDRILSISGLTNIPSGDDGTITFENLPAGFTAEPNTITLPNPDGTQSATITANPNTFKITETDNTGNSETYTIGMIDLAKLTRFTPGLHIKVAEGGTDITSSLMITEEANNMIRIVGLTNKLGDNQYTLTIEQVSEFFTTPNGAAIERTIAEPTEEFSSGPGIITGGTGPTFELTNSGESTATEYTLVVDFREPPQLSITSTDINSGIQTNVDSGTIIPITTATCQLLTAPTVTVAGVSGGKVADTTPFPRYYDRERDMSNVVGTDTNFTVTRRLSLEAGDGTVISTGFEITLEFPACTTFAGGTGNDDANAYEIDNAPRLELLSHLVNIDNSGYGVGKFYKITADIDMGLPGLPLSELGSGTTGKGFLPIGDGGPNRSLKTTVFDCGSNTISGLYINRPSRTEAGLVGLTSGSTIKDCYLIDVNVTGSANVGGLVGFNGSSSSISGSYATGSVTGRGSYVGGLVGVNDNSTIYSSYATGSVRGNEHVGGLVGGNQNGIAMVSDSYATGSVSGNNHVGGLVGLSSYNGMIINSYATGPVTTTGASAGSLVGWLFQAPITNSYGTGSVTGTGNKIRGLIGTKGGSPSPVINSYWNTETTGQTSSSGGIGRTTLQMQVGAPVPTSDDAVYVGWETSTWNFTAGQYPRLINVVCANRQYNQAATDCTSTLQ